jgi:hypothetical protein
MDDPGLKPLAEALDFSLLHNIQSLSSFLFNGKEVLSKSKAAGS